MNLYKVWFHGLFSESIFVVAKSFNEAKTKASNHMRFKKVERIDVVATDETHNDFKDFIL